MAPLAPGGPERPGAGLRVTPQRLLPLSTVGGLFAFGLGALLLTPLFLWDTAGLLESGVYRHPRVLALLHLYALGWGTSVALGALQQFTVVVYQVERAHPRLTLGVAVLHMAGTVALVAGFWGFQPLLLRVGAYLLLGAFLGAAGHLLATVRRSRRRTLATPFLLLAAAGLVALAGIGAALAVNLATGWLGAAWRPAFDLHVLLGPAGWFTVLVFGVSYELSAFFGLTRGQERREQGGREGWRLVFALAAAGLVAGGIPGASAVLPGGGARWAAVLLATSALLFVWDLRGIYRPREAVRRHATLAFVRVAHGLLVALALAFLAVGLAGPPPGGRFPLLAGLAFFPGWVTNTILGYLYRILPFLVWHNKYWGRARELAATPFPQMVDQRLARAGLVLYNAGLGLLLLSFGGGFDSRPAIMVYGAGVAVSGFNLLRTFFR